MLIREAAWLGEQLATLDPSAVFPLLNVGSSTHHFRTVEQPWIDAQLFAPARAKGHAIVHVDLKAADGVDRVGDISDPAFAAELATLSVRGVLCTNLLEHVLDVDATCRSLWALVPPGGLLVMSGPLDYPLHRDPIDNGFRPTPAELAARFPGAEIVVATVIEDQTLIPYITTSVGTFVGEVSRIFTPFLRFQSWKDRMQRFRYLNKPFTATGLVLRKRAA